MHRLRFIFAALLIAVVAFTGYWFALADQAEAQFNAWKQAQMKDGAQFNAELKRTGFPWSVTLKLSNVRFEKPEIVRINAPEMKIVFPCLMPFRPMIQADAQVQFFFTRANYNLSIQKLNVTLIKPWITPQTMHDTSLVLLGEFYNLGLDPAHKVALGNLVQELDLRAKLKGAMPELSQKASLADWRDAGGVVELERIKMLWGSLGMEGKGTLALDKQFQPLGSFSSTISGYEQALDVMREQGQLQPLGASLIKAALKLLEDPKAPADEPKRVTIPITIQNNALSAAGVNLLKWEPYPLP